jgi:hypothetical protein
MARTIERAWANEAAAGGVLGGAAYLAFTMFMGLVAGGVEGLSTPLRMIGAMILGDQALQPAYLVSTAIVVGVVIHLGLSVGFALLFIALAQPVSTMRSTNTLLVTGSIYGLVLWLVNFYVIAAVFGWPWFAEQTNPLVQFLGHTYFYGWILGMHLSRYATVVPEPPPARKAMSSR